MLYIRGTSQGSVAAYLILKSVNIWQNYKQKRGCLVHFLRLLAVCWPGASGARVTGTAAAACDGRTRRAGSFSREWRCRRQCLRCDRTEVYQVARVPIVSASQSTVIFGWEMFQVSSEARVFVIISTTSAPRSSYVL